MKIIIRYVPESFQKKQNRDKKEQEVLVENRKTRHNDLLKKRQEWTQRAKKYHQTHSDLRRSLVKKRREVFKNK